jgi:hypothetical protein
VGVKEMMLLCVDGIDPDLVHEYEWGKLFQHNYKLEIPEECFVPDVELGSTPHTTRVWATIFSGQKIDYGLIKREGLRKQAHDFLVRSGITWRRKKKRYTINPTNENLDTIFNHYDSFAWNIPTISPEWIATFPSYEAFVEYCKRELWMWFYMTFGAEHTEWDLEAYYLRFLDFVGHNDWKNLRSNYDMLFTHVSNLKLKGRKDIILLSDHGCRDGLHTNFAYLGSDEPINARSVDELRMDFERMLDGPLNG